jgi:hypothetical protein
MTSRCSSASGQHKVDPEILAGLLAANYLPQIWLPDAQTVALRRQLQHAHIAR